MVELPVQVLRLISDRADRVESTMFVFIAGGKRFYASCLINNGAVRRMRPNTAKGNPVSG